MKKKKKKKRMRRDTSFRISPIVDIDHLDEPYTHYFSNGRTIDDSDIMQLPGLPRYESLGFPHRGVAKYIWTHQGANDYINWYALFIRDDGLFGLYIAYCDYTGFSCEGDQRLYIGPLENIIKYAMDDDDYEIYIEETIEP